MSSLEEVVIVIVIGGNGWWCSDGDIYTKVQITYKVYFVYKVTFFLRNWGWTWFARSRMVWTVCSWSWPKVCPCVGVLSDGWVIWELCRIRLSSGFVLPCARRCRRHGRRRGRVHFYCKGAGRTVRQSMLRRSVVIRDTSCIKGWCTSGSRWSSSSVEM